MAKMEFDVATLHALWYSKMTNAELCLALKVSRGSLDVLRKRYKLDNRPFERNNPEYKVDTTPTPEEIAERSAAIRATWSDEEREKRAGGPGPVRWQMPAYAFDRRDIAFHGVTID